MKQNTVHECQLMDIRRYSDTRGYLSVIENDLDIPFDIKRIYYLYMVPEVARGAHAHKELQQLLIATSGSVDVIMDDGDRDKFGYAILCGPRDIMTYESVQESNERFLDEFLGRK
jgi:dTDP-4-dehydrorhamnose 3,5-epimerase-like enzyme